MEMESAGDAVTGFDMYNVDSGKITITSFGEAPMLAARVAEGSLPPVEERLPDNPLVMEPWEEIGTYGGTLRTTSLSPTWDPIIRHTANAELVEMLPSPTVHYANLVGVETRPGVYEDWSISDDGTSWTFTLRRGMKWSDGEPVTTEDVRFFFEDTMENEELYPNYPVWAAPASCRRGSSRGSAPPRPLGGAGTRAAARRVSSRPMRASACTSCATSSSRPRPMTHL